MRTGERGVRKRENRGQSGLNTLSAFSKFFIFTESAYVLVLTRSCVCNMTQNQRNF